MLPRIPVVQNTGEIRWDKIELLVFAADTKNAEGELYTPESQQLQRLKLTKIDAGFKIVGEHQANIEFEVTGPLNV